MKLSRRDKKLLIFLALFLVLAGVYQFAIEPTYLKLQQFRRATTEKSAELAKVEVKVRRLQALTELREELRLKAGRLKASLNQDLLNVQMPQRIKTITALAQSGATVIGNLRPMTFLEAEGGAKREALVIEGETTAADFKRFLSGLNGMDITELALNRSDRKNQSLKYYLHAGIIPQDELALLADVEAIQPVEPVEVAEEPVVIVTEELPAEPEIQVEEESAPVFDLSHLTLLGISLDDNGGMAIVSDNREGADFFLRKGDLIGEYKVSAIDRQGVELQDHRGESGRLQFPDTGEDHVFAEPIEALIQEPAAPPQERPVKPGRLGIRLKELTPALAKSKNLPVEEGLLILKGRQDAPDVQVGDALVAINGTAVKSFFGARKVLGNVFVGDAVEIKVSGSGKEPRTVTVTALE